MKVTFVMYNVHALTGGVKVVALHAERLKSRGHEIVVVAPPPFTPTWKDHLRAWIRGERRRPRTEAPYTPFQDASIELRLLDRYRPVTEKDVPDADVIVATLWSTAEWVTAMPPNKGAQALFIQGYEVVPGTSLPELDRTWRLPLQKIVVSRWLRDLAADRFGDPGAIVVPNGVDPRLFHAEPRAKQGRLTVGWVYSSARIKGGDIVLKAVEEARREVPALSLVLFGADPPGADLPLPPGTEFHLRPSAELLRSLYSRCDVWLWGSRREGFGLPMLEAMACRTPVIATPTGVAPELLADGGGFLVAAENPSEMARRMVEIDRMSREQWTALSDRAVATSARYRWEDSTPLFEQALERTIDRARGGAVGRGPNAGKP